MSLKIVELYGSPAAGKTFLANQLQAALTLAGVNSLYVHEFIKDHAVRKLPITPEDQLWIAGNQFRIESSCYGEPLKYSVIVTDSPVSLAGFYAYYYADKNPAYLPLTELITEWQRIADTRYHNDRMRFRVPLREKYFQPAGRFENCFADALKVDEALSGWLERIPYTIQPIVRNDGGVTNWLRDTVDSLK